MGVPKGHILDKSSIDMSKHHLLWEVNPEKKVAYITLNRPDKLNALTTEDFYRMQDLMEIAELEDDIHSIVIRGAGDCFSTGADASLLGHLHGIRTPKSGEKVKKTPQRDRIVADRFIFREMYQRFARCGKVTIIQCHSYSMGMCMWFPLLGDIVIASDDAVFGHSAYRMTGPSVDGLIGYWILKIGTAKTKEMLITGKYMDAKEALACGLVNEVVPRNQLEKRVDEWVQACALQPIDGIVAGKLAFDMHMDMLGAQNSIDVGVLFHTITTNMRFEEDEFSFFKDRRDAASISDSFKERDRRFASIPGFDVIKRPTPVADQLRAQRKAAEGK
jgi:enoyl-CoA hydratase